MEKLLLVDSGSKSTSALKSYLTDIGYSVSVIVKTAEQAVENVKIFDPDFIVMDFNIRNKTAGFRLYDNIRERNKNIPILYMSAPAA